MSAIVIRLDAPARSQAVVRADEHGEDGADLIRARLVLQSSLPIAWGIPKRSSPGFFPETEPCDHLPIGNLQLGLLSR